VHPSVPAGAAHPALRLLHRADALPRPGRAQTLHPKPLRASDRSTAPATHSGHQPRAARWSPSSRARAVSSASSAPLRRRCARPVPLRVRSGHPLPPSAAPLPARAWSTSTCLSRPSRPGARVGTSPCAATSLLSTPPDSTLLRHRTPWSAPGAMYPACSRQEHPLHLMPHAPLPSCSMLPRARLCRADRAARRTDRAQNPSAGLSFASHPVRSAAC
jgi:hypothetical protein